MTNTDHKKTVLVTGGSGFIAMHCILKLLDAGYTVKTTVRSLSREAEVRAMLGVGGVVPGYHLSFIAADLGKDAGWAEAVAGCHYVLHVASPTPVNTYKHEDEMIIPAREGVLRVLRAAARAGVKRVVLTSSFGAIAFGHPKSRRTPFTEKDRTITDSSTPAYQKSKALAEQAAWEFIGKEGGDMELSVVNPVAVLGPVLGPDFSHSIQITRRMLDGEVAACPKISSCYIDVRDVADLHLLAMTHPKARGERFLATTGKALSMLDVAKVLKSHLGAAAAKVPSKEIPDWLMHMLALRNPSIKLLLPMLGRYMQASGDKAKSLLGWAPRPNEEAIADTAESLIKLGIVKNSQCKPK